jgi:hypothetical protein
MKLEIIHNGFLEVIKSYTIWETIDILPNTVPSGAKIRLQPLDDERSKVSIIREYPFNNEVKAARLNKINISNLMSDIKIDMRYNVDNWTPEKLTEIQLKQTEKRLKYNALLLRLKEAVSVYNEALERQRLEIEGYNKV